MMKKQDNFMFMQGVYQGREEMQAKVEELEKQLAEERSKHEWISVDDKLPEDLQSVLFFRPTATFDQCRVRMYRSSKGLFVFDGAHHVTHWMPLPGPPKENK